ncbi:MAG TPA: alpha/beta fold hydrolase [Isosphaeraceae bacterium]|jgi:alpha-beta hydrolase superfamily lysophospholipase|nr:alpha/beta fold hydrolase [Isosphaeraceae bacterium]
MIREEVQESSDSYPIAVRVWPAAGPVGGRVVVVHGVQSHGGWYHDLGRTLAGAGFEAHFPDRRGSGANGRDRGDTPSARRLVLDLIERLEHLHTLGPEPIALAGISWGAKLGVLAAAERPDLVAALALICPGLTPRVGVPLRERLGIAAAMLSNPRKRFPIPLSDPALFTASPAGRAFIADDSLGLRTATARLLTASVIIDRRVRRALPKVRQLMLLMLAGQDRIVDNAKTKALVGRMGSDRREVIEYSEAHHTLEFEPDPSRYARDLIAWLERALGLGVKA